MRTIALGIGPLITSGAAASEIIKVADGRHLSPVDVITWLAIVIFWCMLTWFWSALAYKWRSR